MNEQVTVYYIGGPWDLHKEAKPGKPNGVLNVRVMRNDRFAARPQDLVAYDDHAYRVLQVGERSFIALHSDVK